MKMFSNWAICIERQNSHFLFSVVNQCWAISQEKKELALFESVFSNLCAFCSTLLTVHQPTHANSIDHKSTLESTYYFKVKNRKIKYLKITTHFLKFYYYSQMASINTPSLAHLVDIWCVSYKFPTDKKNTINCKAG